MRIPIVQTILSANDHVANENRAVFDAHGVYVVNVMASPGAGKTSLILATIEALSGKVQAGVIEGDVASRIDADTIAARGIPVVQINTGGSCHLDAPMVRSSLSHLPLNELKLLFIENVGNLICPASFALGAHLALVVPSVPEGDDKPYKYPGMFSSANAVLLNKSDMLDVFEFDREYFKRGVAMVNPDVPFFVVSCRTGDGIAEWSDWLMKQMQKEKVVVEWRMGEEEIKQENHV
jgi:hydrogenase nickel incorporation protein HypB